MSEDSGDMGVSTATPEITDVEKAVLHLVLTSLDLHRAITAAEITGNEALVKETAERYWRAFTRGWSRERHARVYLMQCIDEARVGKAFATAFAARAREKLNGSTRATPFDGLFEMFSSAPWRESFESSVQQEEFSEADAVRLAYSAAYPLEARRLRDELLQRAITEWRRAGGARKSLRDPTKWQLLAELCESIGLGPVKPTTLESDWHEWDAKERSRTVVMPDVTATGPDD